MRVFIAFLVALAALPGCTVRGMDTKLTPQLMSNGELVYMYSDLANFAQKEADPSAETNRLKELSDWMTEANLCQQGFEVIKRQPVMSRQSVHAGKIYYFVKCK